MTKKEYNSKYYRENREKLLAQNRKWRQNNRDKVLAQKARYRKDRKEELNQKQKEHYHTVCKPRDNEAIMGALKIYGGQCQTCKDKDLIVLQWHHRGGDRKTHNESNVDVSKRVIAAGERLEDIMLVCANCHIHQDLIDGTSNKSSRMREIAELWGE